MIVWCGEDAATLEAEAIIWWQAICVEPLFKLQALYLATQCLIFVFHVSDEWLEGLGEYEVVIPRRVNGLGEPVLSPVLSHFPSRRRSRRSADLQHAYPGVYSANNPDFPSEENHPGDPLIPAPGDPQDSREVSVSDSDHGVKDLRGLRHADFKSANVDSSPIVHARTRQEDFENTISPVNNDEVRHSYRMRHAASRRKHWDNYIDHPTQFQYDNTHQSQHDFLQPKNRDPLGHQLNSPNQDSSESESTNEGAGQGDPEDEDWSEAHYSLEAFGRQFDLHLEPNLDFLSQGVVIQHLDADRTWLSDDRDVGLHCFHRGTVAGDPRSSVVLSIRDHLVSSLHFTGVRI